MYKRQIYTTNTDNAGNFSIEVLGGSYEIVINITLLNGSLVSRTYSTDVNQDTIIETENTIEPVTLFAPTSASADGFTLNWSEYVPTNFADYKLYSHTSSNIDQNTGTLIYTGTSITDINFFVTENLVPSEINYYRVFVSDTTGQIAGSNVIAVTIENINLMQNGSFEENTVAPPSNWGYLPSVGALVDGTGADISISTTEAFEGNQSVRYNPPPVPPGSGAHENSVTQRVLQEDLVPNGRYKVSFYMKYRDIDANNMPNSFRIYFFGIGQSWTSSYVVNTFDNPDVWELHEFEFEMGPDILNDFFLSMELWSGGTTDFIGLWVDNVKMIRISN